MKTKLLNVVIPIAGLALLAAGCHGKKQEQAARPPSPVNVAKTELADVPVLLSSFGRLRALNDVNVKAQVSGVVESAPFVEGTTVQAGDVLFTIDKRPYQAQLDQSSAQLLGAQASLRQSRETLERNEKLKDQNLISQEDYDQLATAVQAAESEVKLYTASVEQAQINLNYCTVTAMVTGVTGKRLVDPGNVVSSGGETLVNIRTQDPLYLDFSLTEVELPRIRKALDAGAVRVLVFLPENAGNVGLFKGQLKLIDNTIDEQSGTISLRAVMDNEKKTLWPGQFVYAYPMVEFLTNAVLAPQDGVSEGKDGPYAFVVKDNKVELRNLVLGPMIGEAVVIEKGLKEGETLVTKGQLGLWPGASVSVVTSTDDEEAKSITKKMADPNVLATVHMLASRGEPESKIALFLGVAGILREKHSG